MPEQAATEVPPDPSKFKNLAIPTVSDICAPLLHRNLAVREQDTSRYLPRSDGWDYWSKKGPDRSHRKMVEHVGWRRREAHA